MSIKRSHIYLLIIVASVLFAGGSLVFAQSFTEPGQGTTLEVPLSTSNAPQAINSALGVGISSESDLPDNETLYIKGSALSKPQDGGKPTDVVVDKTPTDASDGTTFSIQGSQAKLGTTCSSTNSQVCVMETSSSRPAVNILQDTGTGLFGETSVAGKSGIYGQGYYGVEAVANGGAIALKAQSCNVSGGSTGFCTEYGTAGFFDGDFIVMDKDSAAGILTGALNGNGENLYRVESLYNMQEGDAPLSKGIAFKSFGVTTNISVPAHDLSYELTNLASNETFISIDVVEGNGTVFSPAKDITVSYDPGAKNVTLQNTSGTDLYVRAVMSYLLADN